MPTKTAVTDLKTSFSECQALFEALGDLNRQNILLTLCDATCATGLRVGTITAAVNLSRPAVSHHLKILRDANLVSVRHEGAMNYYYADIHTNFDKLQTLVTNLNTLKEQTITHD